MKKIRKMLTIILISSIITTASYKPAKAFDFGLCIAITSCVLSTTFKIINLIMTKCNQPKGVSVGTQTFNRYLLEFE